jgi:hypothetical protein
MGNHCREGIFIEVGKVTSLTEAGSVEITIEELKEKPTQDEVAYTVGDQPQTNKINVRTTLTIDEMRERIALAHKGSPIVGLASAGGEINDQPLEDWLVRTDDAPFQIMTSKVVTVILGWRGLEMHMAARESWTEKEFTEADKQQLHHKGKIRIEPQGLSAWEVEADFV